MNQIDNSHPDELKICKNEIIEIGAVKLDDTYKEIDSFKTYVKPGITPVTSRITNLTGITNEMVDDAPDFAIAMPEIQQKYSFFQRTGRSLRRSWLRL